jgi:hypothetical protein
MLLMLLRRGSLELLEEEGRHEAEEEAGAVVPLGESRLGRERKEGRAMRGRQREAQGEKGRRLRVENGMGRSEVYWFMAGCIMIALHVFLYMVSGHSEKSI